MSRSSGIRSGPSRRPNGHGDPGSANSTQGSLENFDMLEWHPQFQSCVRYFVDHAQYTGPVQALTAFINIQLPFQKTPNAVLASNQQGPAPMPTAGGRGGEAPGPATFLGARHAVVGTYPFITLTPYIRRLVVTGFDFPKILHAFFGDDWQRGIGPLHEAERRNYLFAAKSDNWLTVKQSYDMEQEQLVPFLRPLQGTSEREIATGDTLWSQWLAMQDWMLGPRAPDISIEPMAKEKDDSGE